MIHLPDSGPESHWGNVEPSSQAGTDPSRLIEADSKLASVAREEVEVKDGASLVVLTDPRSPGADRFRYLRMRLRELAAKGTLKSLVITSPIPQDGKSTVALNLATALAEGGQRKVLMIEADLHRPSLAKTLGIPARPGLAECLESGLDPLPSIFRLEPLNWYLLHAGTPVGNPTEILHSGATARVLDALYDHFEWILIDTPPVAPLSDALSLANLADASLLVLRSGFTPQAAAEEALALLGPGKVAGIVLNGAEGLNRLYHKYSSYYGRK
jgi:capsular exopolysaccharide synthesis family protein